MKKLYEMILIDTVNKNEGNKVKLREEKIKERENIKLKVEEIEDRFANKDITTETFNNIINRYQVKRREINAEIENLNQIGDSLTNYIDDGLKMLLNLNSLFLNSDYKGKRIMAGSLFSEKLILGKNNCRTTKVNEVLNLLTMKINNL